MRKWITRGAVGADACWSAAPAPPSWCSPSSASARCSAASTCAVTPVAARSDAASARARALPVQVARLRRLPRRRRRAAHVVVDDGKGMLVRAAQHHAGAERRRRRPTRRSTGCAAIRHGVKPDGRPLLIMPSEDYNRFTDADLAASSPTSASCRRRRRARRQSCTADAGEGALRGRRRFRDAAEKIDHTLPPAQPVPEGVTRRARRLRRQRLHRLPRRRSWPAARSPARRPTGRRPPT